MNYSEFPLPDSEKNFNFSTMEQKTAKLISGILHPLFIPLFLAVLIFKLNVYPFSFYSPKAMYIVLALIFTFNVLTPLIFIFLFKKAGYLRTFTMDERSERIFPLIIYAVLLYVSTVLSRRWDLPPLWDVTLLMFAMLTLFTLLITLFFKISIHTVGWGGLSGLTAFLIFFYKSDYFVLLTMILLLSGIVAWARAALKTHKAGELITGFVAGFLLILTGLMIVIR